MSTAPSIKLYLFWDLPAPRGRTMGEGVRTSPATGGGVGDAALNVCSGSGCYGFIDCRSKTFVRAVIDKMTGETVPEKKIRFYTTGYAGKDVHDLKPLVDGLGSMLVDVRFSPKNETLRWRPVYLKALLRDKYHHLPQLGNRPSRRGQIQIQNLELGLKVLISLNESVILLCECAGTSECHRFLIARELGRKGFETEEFENWK